MDLCKMKILELCIIKETSACVSFVEEINHFWQICGSAVTGVTNTSHEPVSTTPDYIWTTSNCGIDLKRTIWTSWSPAKPNLPNLSYHLFWGPTYFFLNANFDTKTPLITMQKIIREAAHAFSSRCRMKKMDVGNKECSSSAFFAFLFSAREFGQQVTVGGLAILSFRKTILYLYKAWHY